MASAVVVAVVLVLLLLLMPLLLPLPPPLPLRLLMRPMMRRPQHQNWSRRGRVQFSREATDMASRVPRRPLKDRRQCLPPICRA